MRDNRLDGIDESGEGKFSERGIELNTSSKPKVISYENAMVAVCDILGFKVILNSLPLEEIVEDDFAYLRKALYSSLHQDKTPEHTPTLEEFQAQNRVGFA